MRKQLAAAKPAENFKANKMTEQVIKAEVIC